MEKTLGYAQEERKVRDNPKCDFWGGIGGTGCTRNKNQVVAYFLWQQRGRLIDGSGRSPDIAIELWNCFEVSEMG